MTADVTIAFRVDGMRLVNETNAREHWAVRKKRAAWQRGRAKVETIAVLRRNANVWTGLPDAARAEITIARIGPARLDDDNLAASGKHVRDGIADALGIDDGSPRLRWTYEQRSEGRGVYAALVTIVVRDGDACGHTPTELASVKES